MLSPSARVNCSSGKPRGLLHPIDLKDGGGIRAIRYAASEVEALGKRFIEKAREPQEAA
jgi:hypothetical protein